MQSTDPCLMYGPTVASKGQIDKKRSAQPGQRRMGVEPIGERAQRPPNRFEVRSVLSSVVVPCRQM